MRSPDVSTKTLPRPYPSPQNDPKYDEVKKVINDCPPEKMDKLRTYIMRLSRDS